MSIEIYMLIGIVGAAIYAIFLWGGLEMLRRRDVRNLEPGADA